MLDIFKGQTPKTIIDIDTGEIKKNHREIFFADAELGGIIKIEHYEIDNGNNNKTKNDCD